MNVTGAQFEYEARKRRHAIVYFGDRVTVVGDLRKTLAPGTVRAMLAQLGLDETDFT